MLNDITITGKRLREARKAAFPDLSAAEVARQLSITRQTLNDYENDRSQPSADVLVRMAVLYSVDMRELATIPAKAKVFLQKVCATA